MKKILHIISSPNGADSQSIRLAGALLERFPGGRIREKDLNTDVPPSISQAYVYAAYTDPAQRTPAQQALLRYSDQVIDEVRDAEVIVISTPVHNFGIPAVLKAWIDQLVRPGVTSGPGAKGLDHKKVYVTVASGRTTNPEGFVGPYLQAILGSIGLADVTVLTLKGTAQRAIQQEDYDHLIKQRL